MEKQPLLLINSGETIFSKYENESKPWIFFKMCIVFLCCVLASGPLSAFPTLVNFFNFHFFLKNYF